MTQVKFYYRSLLNLFLHLADYRSVTMPASLLHSNQQSAKNNFQNRLDLTYRTTLHQFFLNGKPNSRRRAKPSSSVLAVVTKVMFIPSNLLMLSMLISGKMICSVIPRV